MDRFHSNDDQKPHSPDSQASASSHPVRQRELLFRNMSEEEFLKGSRIPRYRPDAYPNRKGLSPSEQYVEMRQKTFEKTHASLQVFWRDLSDTLDPYISVQHDLTNVPPVTDPRSPTIERLQEMRDLARSLPERLTRLAKKYGISQQNFESYAKEKIQSMKDVISTMKIMGASKEVMSMEENLQPHENNYTLLLDKKSLVSDLTTLEGNIRELLDQIFDVAKMKVAWTITIKKSLFTWIDSRSQESPSALIGKSLEYGTLKTSFSDLQQYSEEMERFGKNKNTTNENTQEIGSQKDKILGHALRIHREFNEKYQAFNENHLKNPMPEITEEWRKEGRSVFERTKDQIIKREKEGMVRSVIERSWKSFYTYTIGKLNHPDSYRAPIFKALMRDKLLKGNENDYYVVLMYPKLPYNMTNEAYAAFLSYKSRPLIAYVNPIEGVVVNVQADRETEKKWRDEWFPKDPKPEEMPRRQEWLEKIKRQLEIKDIPKAYLEPLHPSDLSILAYLLVVESEHEGNQLQSDDQDPDKLRFRGPDARSLLSANDLSPVPLTEMVGAHIENPEIEAKLLKYKKAGEMTVFERGEEGFDLVMATHCGRGGSLMHFSHPDIVGEIDCVGIYTEPDSGLLNIKIFLNSSKKSDA